MPSYDVNALVRRGAGECFERYEGNPILTADDWPYPCNGVFNPAAVRLESGETLLLVRVEDHRGFSHLTAAWSADGFTNWRVDTEPTLVPLVRDHPEEAWGIEDPRIVWVDELSSYALTYTAYSKEGPVVALAFTRDFKTFERKGAIMPSDDKNAALFPRRIGDRWVLLHRPMSRLDNTKVACIALSYSPDLMYWSEAHRVMKARQGGWWDGVRIGIAGPPLETEEGWLLLYHGVRSTVSGDIYRVGMALLDLDEPSRVIRRGSGWVLGARAPYERIGDVPNVVFPCGHVYDEASGELRLYYGAADTCVAVATAQVADLLDWLRTST